MSKSKRTAQERSAELRALLGCGTTERTADAARRLLAERDKLRQQVADMGKGLATAWETIASQDAPQTEGANRGSKQCQLSFTTPARTMTASA